MRNLNYKYFKILISKNYGLNIIDLRTRILLKELDFYSNLVIFIEVVISLRTIFFIYLRFFNYKNFQNWRHWMALEIVWTVLPILVLIFLGFPSLKLLYISDILNFKRVLNLKIMGYQWCWRYTFKEFDVTLDCGIFDNIRTYVLGEEDLLVLPIKCVIKGLISSYDVLHSWALPSLIVKMDACPGRLNFFTIIRDTPGMIVGQCRELCGRYHSWMPICLEFTSLRMFVDWVKVQLSLDP